MNGVQGTYSTSWTVTAQPEAVAPARHRASAQLRLWGYPLDRDQAADVELIVSELVTNGLRYGKAERLTVMVCANGEEVFLAVMDANDQAPSVQAAAAAAENGRGLALVAAYATTWGTERTRRGKAVWATLPLPAPDRVMRRRALLARLIRQARPRPYVGVWRTAF